MKSKPKYMTLVNDIDTQITARILNPSHKLPSIQNLALQYCVSKNTVIRALHILEARGQIEARPKSGYFVCCRAQNEPPSQPEIEVMTPSKVNMPELFQDIILRGAAFDILSKHSVASPHHLLSKLHRHINRAMRNKATQKSEYYDEPLGSEELREQLSVHYQSVGTSVGPKQICITSGCQNALFLALMATCKAGDNVAIESPGFYGVIQLIEQLDLHAVEIPCSSVTGMDTSSLAKVLTTYKIKACVLCPSFSTPSGSKMTIESKKRLVELANVNDFAIIEDDIYGDLGFETRPETIKSFDTQHRVILCGSFSKTLSRDLRIGWIMPARWQERVVKLKLISNLACSQAVQSALATFMRTGDYKRHLSHKRRLLQANRDQLIYAIRQHIEHSIKLYIPEGGLCVWIELTKSIDTHELYNRAIKKGIVLAPGTLFSVGPYFSNCMRLSFSHATIDERERAVFKLGKLINKAH